MASCASSPLSWRDPSRTAVSRLSFPGSKNHVQHSDSKNRTLGSHKHKTSEKKSYKLRGYLEPIYLSDTDCILNADNTGAFDTSVLLLTIQPFKKTMILMTFDSHDILTSR